MYLFLSAFLGFANFRWSHTQHPSQISRLSCIIRSYAGTFILLENCRLCCHTGLVLSHLSCLVIHCPFAGQVTFVAHQQLVHILICIPIYLVQPRFDIVEAFHVSDIINDLHAESVCVSVYVCECICACSPLKAVRHVSRGKCG